MLKFTLPYPFVVAPARLVMEVKKSATAFAAAESALHFTYLVSFRSVKMLFVIILLLELSVFIFFVAESRHILPRQQQLLCIVVRDQQCGAAAAAAEFLCFFLPSPYHWLRRFSPRLVSSRPRCRAVFVPFVFWHNNWPDQQLFVPSQRRFLLSARVSVFYL